jgi:zinc protease
MSHMRKIIIVLVLLFPFWVSAQKGLDKLIEPDEAVRVGRLSNGMTYYIRANKIPEGRASYYLVTNAGALLEKDNQQGLAHFLEHMAFNGTKSYPGKTMLNMLEKHGVKFGENINAITQQEKTVYNLSSVPTTSESLIDSTLTVLHDWSYYISLDEKEIDAERGVILEEKRSRAGADTRVREQIFPSIFNNSIYSQRDVIGPENILKTFKYEELRAFYHDWYRTDLQAIIIVGDFNEVAMERKVIQMFSKIPPAKNSLPKPEFTITDNPETDYIAVADKELTEPNIVVYYRRKTPIMPPTGRELKKGILESLFNSMVAQRISDLIQTSVTPFLNANIGTSSLVNEYSIYSVSVTPKNGKELEAIKKVYEINENIRRNGFNQDELDRVVTNLLVGFQTSYQQKDKRDNEAFISDYTNNFLVNAPMPSIEFLNDFFKETLSEISVKEVNALLKEWYTTENRVIVVTGPDKDKFLSKEAIIAAIEEVENAKNLAKLKEKFTAVKLFSIDLKPGKVLGIKKLELFNAEEWTLSNGAKVVYKKNNYNPGELLFNAKKIGGLSVVKTEDLINAEELPNYLLSYGLGDHDDLTLQQLLTGNTAGVNIESKALTYNINGTTQIKDVETMMQLVHLLYVKPRFDPAKHQLIMQQQYDALKQQVITPQKIIQDSVTTILNKNNPRIHLFNKEYLDQIDLKKMERLYRENYQDAGGYVFYFIGDIDKDKLKVLVEKYLATLPVTTQATQWKDWGNYFPKGITKKTIPLIMTEKKAIVILSYKKEIPYSLSSANFLNFITESLQLRFTEEVREKAGAAYGVEVGGGTQRDPKTAQSITIQYQCDPVRVEEVKKIIDSEIQKIIANGIPQSDFDKTMEGRKKEYTQIQKINNYWLSALLNYDLHNENAISPENTINVIKNTTMEGVKQFAASWFTNTDQVELTFIPKQ